MCASHIRFASHHDYRCRHLDRTRFERGQRQGQEISFPASICSVLLGKTDLKFPRDRAQSLTPSANWSKPYKDIRSYNSQKCQNIEILDRVCKKLLYTLGGVHICLVGVRRQCPGLSAWSVGLCVFSFDFRRSDLNCSFIFLSHLALAIW
jgi:hypothetical protein